jgi:mxaK protein
MMPARVRRALQAMLLVLAALAGWDAWRLFDAGRVNRLVDAPTQAAADQAGSPPELRFALAYAMAASGALEPALNRYAALHGDTAVGRAARYNSANLLLRQAADLRAGPQPGQALALVELAKESYRAILRQDPGDGSARYNLERAQRLVPEPELADDDPPDERRGAERAATTMRGFSPGLP